MLNHPKYQGDFLKSGTNEMSNFQTLQQSTRLRPHLGRIDVFFKDDEPLNKKVNMTVSRRKKINFLSHTLRQEKIIEIFQRSSQFLKIFRQGYPISNPNTLIRYGKDRISSRLYFG